MKQPSSQPPDKTPPNDGRVDCLWGVDEPSCIRAACFETDPAKLALMAQDLISGKVLDDGLITEELMSNHHLPLPEAIKLAGHWEPANCFGYQLCSRPDAPPEVLDSYALHWDIEVSGTVAHHPNTKLETLHEMAKCENPLVAAQAFSSGRLSPKFIDDMATSPLMHTRCLVALVCKTTRVLDCLVSDPVPQVRLVAVSNSRTKMAAIQKAALEDDDPDVVAEAAKRLKNSAILDSVAERLADIPSEHLRQAVLQNPHSTDYAKTIATLKG